MKPINNLREPMNGFTHFIGIVLSIVGTIFLISSSLNPYKSNHLIAFSIFGLGLILLYSTSTLYHWLKLSDDGILRMRKADHIMIFINIAATYTPVCMIALKNNLGWTLLFIIWSIALAGILIKIFWIQAPRWLSTIIYVLMGWMAIVVIFPLIEVLQLQALVWLFIGGVFFTTGAIIYALKKPDPYPGILGFHEIFHLFVLLGSFSHFWMMYKYIAILN
jgi:hemolysin III